MNRIINKTMLARKFARPKMRPRETPGEMNKTEAAYAIYLAKQVEIGNIQGYRFQPMKLRLADKTWYTPDFIVLTDILEVHEVKGCKRDGKMLWEDDARVKIKVAADLYPEFVFKAVGMGPAGWIFEEFK